jgi:hypothetical protein
VGREEESVKDWVSSALWNVCRALASIMPDSVFPYQFRENHPDTSHSGFRSPAFFHPEALSDHLCSSLLPPLAPLPTWAAISFQLLFHIYSWPLKAIFQTKGGMILKRVSIYLLSPLSYIATPPPTQIC